MSAKELLKRYLDECPLIAIIRGVTLDEAEAIGDAIFEGGVHSLAIERNNGVSGIANKCNLVLKGPGRATDGHQRTGRIIFEIVE